MRGEPLHEVHQELRTIPNIDIPLSVTATVTRLCGRYSNLGVLYAEQERLAHDSGTTYRVYWISESGFGIVEGQSDDPDWSGMQSTEAQSVITAKVRRLEDIREVALAASPSFGKGYNNSTIIETSVSLVLTSGERIDVPKYRISTGGSAQRAKADAFIDRALELVGGRPSAERPQ